MPETIEVIEVHTLEDLEPWWTVVGSWFDRDRPGRSIRWMSNYQALTPQVAEDMARLDTQQEWEATGRQGPAQFIISGIFPGLHNDASTGYARYSDPNEVD